MPSYVVVGASRGLGYEWLRYLKQDVVNTVVGVVRSVQAVQNKLQADKIEGVNLLHADMSDHTALKEAALKIEKITSSIDYLIINGAFNNQSTIKDHLSDFIGKEDILREDMYASLNVNVLGVIYSINAFLPLVRNSSIKKIIVISTGMADTELVLKSDLKGAITYASMKSATNMVVAKYAVELKADGITVIALSPGLVNTRETTSSEEEIKQFTIMMKSFQVSYPQFKGPITPFESVSMQKEVIEKVTIKESGAFLSHWGNKEWL